MSDGDDHQRRGYLPADPKRNETLDHLGLPSLSIHRREDLELIRRQATQGMLPPATIMGLLQELAMLAIDKDSKPRTKIAAVRAVTPLQLGLLKLLQNLHGVGAEQATAANVTNQQINIYLPANGREAVASNGGN